MPCERNSFRAKTEARKTKNKSVKKKNTENSTNSEKRVRRKKKKVAAEIV